VGKACHVGLFNFAISIRRTEIVLGHANEGLKSRLKRRSGKNFRMVPHSFAPRLQILESTSSDASPATNDTRLSHRSGIANFDGAGL
jgi:hypothetical protein